MLNGLVGAPMKSKTTKLSLSDWAVIIIFAIGTSGSVLVFGFMWGWSHG